MVVYNVTVNVDHDVAEGWLQWMKGHHMPEMVATGYFTGAKIFRIVGGEEESGLNYAIQYHAESLARVQLYLANEAERMRADHANRYKDKVVAFRTLLEEV